MRKVNIYTATDFRSPRAKEGQFGYVLETQGRTGPVTLTGFGNVQDATKNLAELEAAVNALKRMTEPCEITICTESAYVAAGLEWVKDWSENGWVTTAGTPVANKEEWEQLFALMKNHTVNVEQKEHSYSQWLKNEMEKRRKPA